MKLPKLPFETPRLLPTGLWAEVERFAARRQGKGVGRSSCKAEVRQCASLLRRTPETVLDVGANVGDYSAAVLDRFPRTTVHAFEPSPDAAARLKGRFAGRKNVFVHEIAASDATGPVTLWSDRGGSGLASLTKRRLDHFGIPFEHRTEVQSDRLDRIMERLGVDRIDWLKLDVEGHELSVLRGMGDRIKEVQLVQFEFGGCNIDTRTYFQDFWYFLRGHGFAVHRLTGSGPLEIGRYRESHESFCTTNYAAVRQAAH
jgi:FkbM family methyltransferase